MIIGFVSFLILFVIIGVLSTLQSNHTSEDYLTANGKVPAWLVALSAIATTNSGYMFIGMIGYTYSVGMSTIWLMVFWIIGDLLASFVVHKKFRVESGKQAALSYSGILGFWNGNNYRILRFISGIIIIIFLGSYAAAQLKAGSKALHVLLGWDENIGAIIGAVIVIIYCFSGGIRASIWTDAAQSIVMVVAMGLMFFTSINQIGGIGPFWDNLQDISGSYTDLFPHKFSFIFILGWFFAGFGVCGQPHIMTRFMTLDNPDKMARVRVYYYGWYTVFFLLTICVGLIARLLLSVDTNFDPELALPTLAKQMLPDLLVGFILAGLFSATMSTADSQVLSCSATISCDILQKVKKNYMLLKFTTLMVTLIALCIAIFGTDSVFNLVMLSWSSLAAAFTPLLTIYVLGWRVKEWEAISMVLLGLIVAILWRNLGLNEYTYDAVPGILSGFMVLGCYKLARR